MGLENAHHLSVLDGVRASADRTPGKTALAAPGLRLSYAELLAAIAAPPGGQDPARMLIAMLAAARGGDEDAPAAWLPASDGAMLPLSHRTLVLRLLNAAVTYGALSRDVCSAVPLPLDSAAGLVAALAPLWLGGTLYLLPPGDLGALQGLVASRAVNQAWLGPAELAALDACPPMAPPGFRAAICVGHPPGPACRTALLAWFGADRVFAESGSDRLGAVLRYPGLSGAGEPVIGAILDGEGRDRRASTLATSPRTPAWRLFPA